MRTLTLEQDPLAVDVVVIGESFTIALGDGRSLSVPVAWYPRLVHATAGRTSPLESSRHGYAIEWPDLDSTSALRVCLRGVVGRKRGLLQAVDGPCGRLLTYVFRPVARCLRRRDKIRSGSPHQMTVGRGKPTLARNEVRPEAIDLLCTVGRTSSPPLLCCPTLHRSALPPVPPRRRSWKCGTDSWSSVIRPSSFPRAVFVDHESIGRMLREIAVAGIRVDLCYSWLRKGTGSLKLVSSRIHPQIMRARVALRESRGSRGPRRGPASAGRCHCR